MSSFGRLIDYVTQLQKGRLLMISRENIRRWCIEMVIDRPILCTPPSIMKQISLC